MKPILRLGAVALIVATAVGVLIWQASLAPTPTRQPREDAGIPADLPRPPDLRPEGWVHLTRQRTLDAEGEVHHICAADLNGDGASDLVTANTVSGSISIMLADGEGWFQAPRVLEACAGPTWVASGLIDRDALPDLVTSCHTSDEIAIFWGKGEARFERQLISVGKGSWPHAVVPGHMNKDKYPDLVVGLGGTAKIMILDGRRGRKFKPRKKLLGVGRDVFALALRDLNRDGVQDILSVNAGDRDLSVILGKKRGGFKKVRSYPTSESPSYRE